MSLLKKSNCAVSFHGYILWTCHGITIRFRIKTGSIDIYGRLPRAQWNTWLKRSIRFFEHPHRKLLCSSGQPGKRRIWPGSAELEPHHGSPRDDRPPPASNVPLRKTDLPRDCIRAWAHSTAEPGSTFGQRSGRTFSQRPYSLDLP